MDIVIIVDLMRFACFQEFVALLVFVVDLHQQVQTLGIILCKESTQDLDDVAQLGLLITLCNVAVLKEIEVCAILAAGSFHFLFQFARFCRSLGKLLPILLFVLERVIHVSRCHFVECHTVIQRAACSLRIQLKEDTAERGFSAARLTDNTERLALININGDVFVCTNIELVLLENGGFCNRKVLFQISNGQ